jgi:hypothetical protein
MLVRLFVPLLLLLVTPLHAEDESLRRNLERVYSEWRAALLAKSVTAWTSTTATYRQVYTRNVIVSQGKPYPEALFDLPIKPPSVLDLKLVEVEAVGQTAHLIYFGRVDLGIEAAEIPENLMVLKFNKEPAGWRFDTTKYINLTDNPEMRKELRSGSAEFLKHPPFNPPGKAPAVPPLCNKPEKVAALRIHAIGYAVTAQVNGFEHMPVIDDAEQQLIFGGMARGPNKVTLSIKQTPLADHPDAARHLEIQVVLATDDPEKPTLRVFRWEPKAHPASEKVDWNVVLDNRTLKGI